MSNTFYVRYHYGAQRVEPISNVEHSYCAFPLFIPEFSLHWSYCWSSEVWESLIMVQQAIIGLLCRYSQSQGRHPSECVRVSIPTAVMHYLQLWLMHRNIIPSHKPYSRMQKHIRATIIFQKRKFRSLPHAGNSIQRQR